MKIKQKGNDTNNNDKIQQNIVDAGTQNSRKRLKQATEELAGTLRCFNRLAFPSFTKYVENMLWHRGARLVLAADYPQATTGSDYVGLLANRTRICLA